MSKNLPVDLSSQARAMEALQAEQMRMAMQEQLMQYEMYAAQQRMQLEAQYQQQLLQQHQQMQQQYLTANLTADDVRRVMQSIKPGESFEVEMYQGFEVHHKKQQQGNTAQILVALILAVAVIVMVLQS